MTEQVERKINYRFVFVVDVVVGKGKNVAKGKEKLPCSRGECKISIEIYAVDEMVNEDDDDDDDDNKR